MNIRAECKERKINAGKWATENAPIRLRWLDRYGEFARRWDEFLESWKWSEALPYAPERRPGLWGCFDLMDAKARFDTYSEARKRNYRGDGGNGTVVTISAYRTTSDRQGEPHQIDSYRHTPARRCDGHDG